MCHSMSPTVEPLNNGHIGTDHLSVIERLSSFRGNNVLPLYRLVYRKVYRGVLYSECPLSEVPLYNILHRYTAQSTLTQSFPCGTDFVAIFLPCLDCTITCTACAWSNGSLHQYTRWCRAISACLCHIESTNTNVM